MLQSGAAKKIWQEGKNFLKALFLVEKAFSTNANFFKLNVLEKIFTKKLGEDQKLVNYGLHISAAAYYLLGPRIFLIYSKRWNSPVANEDFFYPIAFQFALEKSKSSEDLFSVFTKFFRENFQFIKVYVF